jgi:hypothetical protein
MIKEELVGRSFRAAPEGKGELNYLHEHPNKDRLYLAASPNLTKEQIELGKDIGDWKISDIVLNLEKGYWKLIEEEPKMTHKFKVGDVLVSNGNSPHCTPQLTVVELVSTSYRTTRSPTDIRSATDRAAWIEQNYKLKEEPKTKMYKTPKGIEYGVGTLCGYGSAKTTYTITKIDNDRVYFRLSDGRNDISDSINTFNKDLDRGERIVINQNNMTDFKQVDPKTIKFDFSKKCIKTQNKEEYDWVYEVAVANHYTYAGDKIGYKKGGIEQMFFDQSGYSVNNSVSWADNAYTKSSSKYTEITIQDILGNKNMKETIEVGDIVQIIPPATYRVGQQALVLEINPDKEEVYLVQHTRDGKLDAYDQTRYHPNKIKLVSKGKKKEIVGYETVVDLPGIPKGSKSEQKLAAISGGYTYKFAKAQGANTFHETEVVDTKFFKPIYKSDAIEIKFSKYTATLSKEHGLVFTDGEKLPLKEVEKILRMAAKPTVSLGKVDKFDIVIDFTVTTVKVGCKSFTPEDVALVQGALKKLE